MLFEQFMFIIFLFSTLVFHWECVSRCFFFAYNTIFFAHILYELRYYLCAKQMPIFFSFNGSCFCINWIILHLIGFRHLNCLDGSQSRVLIWPIQQERISFLLGRTHCARKNIHTHRIIMTRPILKASASGVASELSWAEHELCSSSGSKSSIQ